MSIETFNADRERAFLEAFEIPVPYIRPPTEFSPTINPRKILNLSDPHEPYGAEYVYADALANHHDAGLCLVTGDLGDYYSKSRFRKLHHVSFKDEVRAIFHRMEWLSIHWTTVKIMLGNHDTRPQKKIQGLFDTETELLILTEQNLLKHLAAYFPNVEVIEHIITDHGIGLTYLWQYGDMIYMHAEISRTQDTAVMEFLSNWLHSWRHVLRLEPYRYIGQGHNHRHMLGGRDGEAWQMFPTASDPYSLGMEYVFSARLYRRPPSVGYSLIYHDEGRVSQNECQNIVLRDE